MAVKVKQLDAIIALLDRIEKRDPVPYLQYAISLLKDYRNGH